MISEFLDLEVSEPLARMAPGTRRLKPWALRRCNLVERSAWLPLDLTRTLIDDALTHAVTVPIEEFDPRTTFGTALLPEQGIGGAWIRIAEHSFKSN